MMKVPYTLFGLVISLVLYGQEPLHNLNQFAPLIYNPAVSSADNTASVSLLSKRTELGPGLYYTNNIINAEYPLIQSSTGKRYGGVGVYAMKKNAANSDMLNAFSFGMAASYNLRLAKNQFLSFGLKGTYHNKQTSLDRLTTESQWLANEFRFDPSADIGETFANNRVNYFSVNTGFLWYLQHPGMNEQTAFIGVSVFNLNTPTEGFLRSQSSIPVSYQVNAGTLVFQNDRWHVMPQITYQHVNDKDVVLFSLSNKLAFVNHNPYDIIASGSIDLLGMLDPGNSVSLGLILHQPSISIGFSYNIPATSASKNSFFENSTEFGLRLMKTIARVQPKRIEIGSTSIGTQREFKFDSQNERQKAQQQSDVEVIQKNIEDLAKVRAVQFHLEKDFHFSFGKAALDEEAKRYLDELYTLLEKNPEYNLEIIGHTDNVGKALANFKLSTARAKAVADYLKQMGLDESRVRFSGSGDTKPKAPNDTEVNRAKNRRVEFIIYVNRE